MPQEIDPESITAETEAMRLISAALAPLTPEQRRVVLDWARQFAAPVMRAEAFKKIRAAL
jgi:hypothetical protein